MAMIVRGFGEPIAKELPMEYALELNRLIELQREGAVGEVAPPRPLDALRAPMTRTSPRCRRSLDEQVRLRSGALRCTHPEYAKRADRPRRGH
jgi:hypothetical protein